MLERYYGWEPRSFKKPLKASFDSTQGLGPVVFSTKCIFPVRGF